MTGRLFVQVVGLEARRQMSYRLDFWIQAVAGFAVHVAVPFFLWGAVFTSTGATRVGGYSFEDLMLYTLLATLVGNVVRGSAYGGSVALEIYQGEYTRYLLYPSAYFPFQYARHLGLLGPALLQFALFGALGPLLLPLPEATGICAVTVARAACAMLLGNLLHYLLLFPLSGVAFWADAIWSLMVMMRFVTSLLGGTMLPLDLFPPGARAALDWLPFPYLFYFPVRTLTGDVAPEDWARGMLVMMAWCVVLRAVAGAVWRAGNRRYTAAGI